MATVIKAHGPIRAGEGGMFNFEDVSLRANAYLDTVRVQAAEIIEKAKQEGEAIRRKAEQDGQQAAIRAVEKVMDDKVTKQLATLLPALKQAADGIIQARQAWLAHWENAAVKLATQIAARVVRCEIERRPQITLSLVKESLDLAAGSSTVQLRMHPDDVAALGKQVAALTAALSSSSKIELIADPQISKGGCRVDTKFGVIDQQVEAQLQRIEEELT